MEREPNEEGRGSGTGKRKTAIARVRVQSGSGTIEVNDRPLEEYFPRTLWTTQVKSPIVERSALRRRRMGWKNMK